MSDYDTRALLRDVLVVSPSGVTWSPEASAALDGARVREWLRRLTRLPRPPYGPMDLPTEADIPAHDALLYTHRTIEETHRG